MTRATTVRIATRGSKLALWQANHVRDWLMRNEPGLAVDLVVLKTQGDKILDRPLSEVGGKGLFVKEIEEALSDGRADVAVHSMKDLPAELAPGLYLAAVPEREDPRDALLLRPGLAAAEILDLPQGARVGTSSLRRVCVIKSLRPDLEVIALRGNVDTRVRKLDEGQLDAIILAMAGLRRLGFGERVDRGGAPLDPLVSVPAIGQGALAIECRSDDEVTRRRLAPLDHAPTAIATRAERAFLLRLGGSCRTPMAAHATLRGEGLHIHGLVGRPDGTKILTHVAEGSTSAPEQLGVSAAEALIAEGADVILRECAAELAGAAG